MWCFVLALCVSVTTRWIIFLDDELVDHVSAWMVREIVDHFARYWEGGFMWAIRDPRIIWGGGKGEFLDPRGSVIRGLPTAPTMQWHTHETPRPKTTM